jgi:hypothetical protein
MTTKTSSKSSPPLMRSAKMSPERVHQFVEELLGADVHAKRVLSFAHGVVGVLHAAALGVHAIGRGLADAMGSDPKHAVKQMDRLLSNTGITVWLWFAHWVKFVVAERRELVVALDWTEFDKDDQATIALYLITSHGRATPLIWKTVRKSELKDRRNEYVDGHHDPGKSGSGFEAAESWLLARQDVKIGPRSAQKGKAQVKPPEPSVGARACGPADGRTLLRSCHRGQVFVAPAQERAWTWASRSGAEGAARGS